MDLREYEQAKFAIAEILRSASLHVPEQNTDLREKLQGLFARLAEDRFNLVVVGRFNRGKTSLMNAILATDRLPTGIVPLTSVITTVGYGSKEQVTLKYANRILDREVPIEDLPRYITQQGNPANVQRIATAHIQLPAEILRRGFYFVDTPGLGSVVVENSLTTEAFLPEADAFILVTSYDSPISEEDVRFFRAATTSGRRIFVVLNKHDIVSPEQREVVIDFVRKQLGTLVEGASPPIFSVSATNALQAKLSRDDESLGLSGISELEAQLTCFLLREKSSEFLAIMCDRAREFLYALPPSPEVESLIAKVGAFGQELTRRDRGVSSPSILGETDAFRNLHKLRSCEICAEIADKLWNFLCKFQYELTTNSQVTERFASHGGLCPFHAWQLQSVASPYGTCVGYPPLLDRLAAKLRDLASTPFLNDVPRTIARLTPSGQDCALCQVRDDAESDALIATAKRLEAGGAHSLNSLSAICINHLAILSHLIRDDDLLRSLLRRQAAILQRSSEDMKRYAIKHDGIRRYLASHEETLAAEHGLLLVSGRRQVNFVRGPLRTRSARSRAGGG